MRSVRKIPSVRRPGAPRSVRWLHRPPADSDGWGTIEIRLGRTATAYRCRAIPTDFGPEHRGFELHKLGPGQQPTGVVYHVLVDLSRGRHRCDCLGHEPMATANTAQLLKPCAGLPELGTRVLVAALRRTRGPGQGRACKAQRDTETFPDRKPTFAKRRRHHATTLLCPCQLP
jgi:hypothetical protein